MVRTLGAVTVGVLVIFLVAALILWLDYGQNKEPTVFSDDLEHFKYGSIGAEVDGYPYIIWRELPSLFPDKLPQGWQTFGFSQEAGQPLPVGLSVRQYGIERVGFNCATCHTSTVDGGSELILGAPANKLDLEGYLGFLFETAADPKFNADNIFNSIEDRGEKLSFVDKLVYRYYVIPKIKSGFEQAKTANEWQARRPKQGPGRTDAGNPWRVKFGMQPENDTMVATVDYPSIWNQDIRRQSWLHWDGNNNSLAERNLSAALAGGATEDSLDHASIERVAEWTLVAPPPQYPYAIDEALAAQGGKIYQEQKCGSCHEPDGEFYGDVTPIAELGTDPGRLDLFSAEMVENFETVGAGRPWQFSHYRKSNGYANVPLDGIWVRAPYLHNGSVPTLYDLLSPPEERPAEFKRGCDSFDKEKVGFRCSEGFTFDVAEEGNGNSGHLYGVELSMPDRLALIEYLKTK